MRMASCPRPKADNLALPLIITMALPVLAILVSQIVRQEWSFKPYDGPSRILLCIPVLFYFLQIKLNFSKIVAFSAPIALLILIPVVYSHPETLERWIGRFATPAVDPTEFGTYSLVLTAFCLFGIETEPDKLNLKFLAYQISGFLAGIYLILGSGTRGSWIAIPPLLVLWAVLNRKNLPPKILKHLGLLILAGIVLICLVRLIRSTEYSAASTNSALGLTAVTPRPPRLTPDHVAN